MDGASGEHRGLVRGGRNLGRLTVMPVVGPMLPSIERLTLAHVTAVPEWHPEHAAFEPFPVHAWVVRHPDGIILVDTGMGTGNQLIDEWYRPEVISLSDALAPVGLEPADIEAAVLSHLHFDHCGQQRMLHAPVFVQATDHEEAQRPRYTVAAWGTIPAERRRLLHGDEEIVAGHSPHRDARSHLWTPVRRGPDARRASRVGCPVCVSGERAVVRRAGSNEHSRRVLARRRPPLAVPDP